MGNSNSLLHRPSRPYDIRETNSTEFPKHGVRLSFIDDFIEFCDGKTRFEGLTTTDVCENFIKPMTSDAKCSFCEMLEHSNHPAVGIATVFISHAWHCRFLEVTEALKYHFQDNMDVVVWFDLFSNNQHKAVSFSFDWWSETFRSAIAQFGHTVMVLAPWNNPIPLTRSWCLFELYCTIDTKSKFEIALSKEQQDLFFADMLRFGDIKINEMLTTIKVEHSECSHKDDQVRIFEVVEKSVGFGQVNAMIFERLRQWVIAITTAAITTAQTHHQDLEEIQLKNTLAVLYHHQGRYEESKGLYQECLAKRRALQGPDHPDTLIALNDLANLYDIQQQYPEAETLYQEYLTKLQILHKAIHTSPTDFTQAKELKEDDMKEEMKEEKKVTQQLVLCMNNLAVCYENQGKYLEAEQLYEDCLLQGERLLGNAHPTILSAMNNLGVLYCHGGRLLEAKQLLMTTLHSRQSLLGEDHPDTLNTLYNMGALYAKGGQFDDAQISYEQCFDKRKKVLGESHPDTMDAWVRLNEVGMMKDRWLEGSAGFEEEEVEGGGVSGGNLELVEEKQLARSRLERCASVRGTIEF